MATRTHLSGLKATCFVIPVPNTRDLFVGNVMGEDAAQQVEVLKPDLLVPETSCIPGPRCHPGRRVCLSVCVCPCVIFSVLVYEHMRMCSPGVDKSYSTTLTSGLKG